MPTDIRIIRAHDCIRATPSGELDLEKARELLAEVTSVAAHSVDYDVILDTRKAQVAMSVTDLWHLAAELTTFARPSPGRRPFSVQAKDLTKQRSSHSAPRTEA